MTYNDRLITLGNALSENVTPPVYHYWRPAKESRYVVWQEDSEFGAFTADNKKQRQGIYGTIDLFTKQEFDSAVEEIQDTLNSIEHLGWRLNSTQYEDETNFIHHEWEFNYG